MHHDDATDSDFPGPPDVMRRVSPHAHVGDCPEFAHCVWCAEYLGWFSDHDPAECDHEHRWPLIAALLADGRGWFGEESAA